MTDNNNSTQNKAKPPGRLIELLVSKNMDNLPPVGMANIASDVEAFILNLKNIEYVNSEGLRSLSIWLKTVEVNYLDLVIRLEHVTPHLIRYLQTLKNHLPKKLEVFSLYVPYFCESCDKDDASTLVTVLKARSVANLKDLLADPVPCKVCKKPMEPDVEPDRFLSVLLEREKW